MPSPLKLVLVDDHKLLTDTWTLMLNAVPGFKVLGTANNSSDALSMIEEKAPDVVLLDINMSPIDGFQLIGAIKKLRLQPQVIALSLYSMPVYVKKMMAAGASGYVTKNSPRQELVKAIREVHRGKKYICQEIINKITDDQPGPLIAALNTLTQRELSIIQQLKLGLSSREIAAVLGITGKTVEVHRFNILKKMGLPNVASLINVSNSQGI